MTDLIQTLLSKERQILVTKGEKDALAKRVEELKKEKLLLEKNKQNFLTAVDFLNKTAKDSRNKTIEIIASLATMTVKAVYGEQYSIRLPYKDKTAVNSSDRMTFQLVRQENGKEIITGLIDEVGGGMIETVSFALRIACIKWTGYTGPIILDEAYKSLSKDDKIEQIATLLSELNQIVGNQIIFSTHMQDIFSKIASKELNVTQTNGVSKVIEC